MTLTQAAKFTRVFVIFFIVFVVISLTGFFGYRIWYANYLASLPPVEEKADPKYGLLTPPIFPISTVSSSNYSYSIDTITGNLPEAPKLVKVFIMPPTTASLLAGEKSKVLAEKFGLNQQPEILSDTSYNFKNSDSELTVNLDSGNFSYKKEATAIAKVAITDNDQKITSDFQSLLEQLGLLRKELGGEQKVLFENPEKQIAQVSIWPKEIDTLQIITPNPNTSLVSGVFTGSASELKNYTNINYTFWPVDTLSFATYPIKSSQQAFEDLKSGKGTIVTEPISPQVSILNVKLVYYQTENYTPYLQPIFVFEGPNFLSFVPAIANEYLDLAK